MATKVHVPVQAYLASSYEPDAEYVEGEIEERPMGEYDHAAWQEAICKWFWKHAEAWNVRVKPELRIKVTPTRYRVPDVTLLDRDLPIEQINTRPPLAVFEVLSPEDSLQRLKRKLEDYKTMGIPDIWVIDPQDATYYRYENSQFLRKDAFVQGAISFAMDCIKELLD